MGGGPELAKLKAPKDYTKLYTFYKRKARMNCSRLVGSTNLNEPGNAHIPHKNTARCGKYIYRERKMFWIYDIETSVMQLQQKSVFSIAFQGTLGKGSYCPIE